MFRFETLEIWKLSVEYGKLCYELAKGLPTSEKFCLTDQLHRAALSISNNIAEGSVNNGYNFRRYLLISIGSIMGTVNILNFAYENNCIDRKTKVDMHKKAELLVRKIRKFYQTFT